MIPFMTRQRPPSDVIDAWSHEPNLDFIRAIAVTCVVMRHLAAALALPARWWFQPQALGIFGVLVFFVHTALVLMMSLHRSNRRGEVPTLRLWGAFLVRRFFRIYPLSVAAVLLTYWVLIPHADEASALAGIAIRAQREDFLACLALVQDVTSRQSILAPLWSLPAEVQMYFVLPLLYLLVERYGARIIAFVCWPISVVIAITIWKVNSPLTVGRYAPCFVAGVLCYGLLRARRPLPFAALQAVIATTLFGYMFLYARIGLQAGLGIVVTIFLGCTLPLFARLRPHWLRRGSHAVAKYSYSVYLFHAPCIWIAFGLGRHLAARGGSRRAKA
jgi:peptidoglycan/LPS O-acetylase OafA/YrhL